MFPWLPLSLITPLLTEMEKRGVSKVARSPRGFFPQYKKAGGNPKKLTAAWQRKRNNFVKRHMAQVVKRNEPLWSSSGKPTRRHLALIAWAYSPDPEGVLDYLDGM